MDIDDYKNIIAEVVDFEIEMSTLVQSRKTLLELKEKREILLEMKKDVAEDIRSIELEYLKRRCNIRSQFEDEETSRLTKFFSRSSSPSQMRARAMRHLESERNTKLEAYEEIKFTTEDLIEQIEDIMVEVYTSMKNILGNVEIEMERSPT